MTEGNVQTGAGSAGFSVKRKRVCKNLIVSVCEFDTHIERGLVPGSV